MRTLQKGSDDILNQNLSAYLHEKEKGLENLELDNSEELEVI